MYQYLFTFCKVNKQLTKSKQIVEYGTHFTNLIRIVNFNKIFDKINEEICGKLALVSMAMVTSSVSQSRGDGNVHQGAPDRKLSSSNDRLVVI